MISLKTPQEIKILQQGGKILSEVLHQVARATKPGVSAEDLDKLAYKLIKEKGGEPSFLNYQPDFASVPFPNSLCVSVNDVVVHGIPYANLIIRSGDIVSLDLGLKYKGLYTDMALTIGVGKINPLYRKMIAVCRGALQAGIRAAISGNTLGDIGYAIQSFVEKRGFVVIKDLVGHGVGYSQHEDPLVLNFGKPHQGIPLKTGMVLALEPMITLDNGAVKEKSDGSFVTANRKVAVHWEKTIAVGRRGPIVITP